MEPDMDWDATLAALRDFFAARDGRAMVEACAAMTKAGGPPFAAESADDLEFAFNRLFVGPGPVPAPPYASVYLDADHRLMGDATRTAAAVYDTLGLSSPLTGSLPDDHLALELDAVLAFRALAARRSSPQLAVLWDYFLNNHLALWVPLFAARVTATPGLLPAIRRAVMLLSQWLADEIKTRGLASAAMTHQAGGTA